MMIHSYFLIWALIQVLICGSQSKPHYGSHATPSEDACIDKSSNCNDNKFQCLTSSYVKRICKKTCNLCEPGNALCPVCKIVESSCETFDVCIPLKREQKLCKQESCTIDGVIQDEQNKCPGAMLYDTQTSSCVAKPTSKALCPVCKIVESSCETFDVCIPLKREQKLCKKASCTIDGVIQDEQNKCPGAMLYDTQTSSCVAKPTGNDLCHNTTCPELPEISCSTVESTCKRYEVCNPNRRIQTLCQKEECIRDGHQRDMCFVQGELYDLETKRCVTPPTGSALCPVKCPGAMLYDTQTGTCVVKPTVCPIDTRSPDSCIVSDDPIANCHGPVGGPSYDCPTGLLCCQDACGGPVCKHPQ